MPQQPQLGALREELARVHHLHLTPAAVESLVHEVLSSLVASSASSSSSLAAQVAAAALARDLRGLPAVRVLPAVVDANTNATMPHTAWLQLMASQDVTQPTVAEQESTIAPSASSRRLLQLELVDGGGGSIRALELSPISAWTPSALVPGCKILVRAGAVIECGLLLLDESHTAAPAGRVETLAASWALERAAAMRSDTTGDDSALDPPPQFRPFAQREQVRAEAERERAVQQARREQEEAALALGRQRALRPVGQLLPPPDIEDVVPSSAPSSSGVAAVSDSSDSSAASRRPASAETNKPSSSVVTSAVASDTKPEVAAKPTPAHLQAGAQERLAAEFEAQQAVRQAKKEAAAASVARKAAAASAAAASVPSVLSSFRTLLSAALHSTHSFSARILDAQLYPPRAPSSDFTLQLTLQDSFSLRVPVVASARVFQALFGTQESFRALMATADGKSMLQKRLQAVRGALASKGFVDVELEIQPPPASTSVPQPPGGASSSSTGGRLFLLTALGDIVKGKLRVPPKLQQPRVTEPNQGDKA